MIPNVLALLAILPVTAAAVERSFTSLRHLTSEERLTVIVLISNISNSVSCPLISFCLRQVCFPFKSIFFISRHLRHQLFIGVAVSGSSSISTFCCTLRHTSSFSIITWTLIHLLLHMYRCYNVIAHGIATHIPLNCKFCLATYSLINFSPQTYRKST